MAKTKIYEGNVSYRGVVSYQVEASSKEEATALIKQAFSEESVINLGMFIINSKVETVKELN